jgi:hypothetical protein
MQQLFALLRLHWLILSLAIVHIQYVHTQLLYQCNFDISNENCFTTEIDVTSKIGIPNSVRPDGPLSDVTSICKRNQQSANIFYLYLSSKTNR